MSFRKTQPTTEWQPLDEIDELVRWALLDEVAGQEPSPQVWEDIKASVMTRSQALPGQLRGGRPWRQLASALQDWARGFIAPWDANWDTRLSPREQAYLLWRENLLLAMMPLATTITY